MKVEGRGMFLEIEGFKLGIFEEQILTLRSRSDPNDPFVRNTL